MTQNKSEFNSEYCNVKYAEQDNVVLLVFFDCGETVLNGSALLDQMDYEQHRRYIAGIAIDHSFLKYKNL